MRFISSGIVTLIHLILFLSGFRINPEPSGRACTTGNKSLYFSKCSLAPPFSEQVFGAGLTKTRSILGLKPLSRLRGPSLADLEHPPPQESIHRRAGGDWDHQADLFPAVLHPPQQFPAFPYTWSSSCLNPLPAAANLLSEFFSLQ